MKFTRVKTSMMACLMAASMVMPGMTALAAEPETPETTPTEQTAPVVVKTVKTDANVTGIPDADKTITFHVTHIDNIDGVKYPGYPNKITDIADKTYDVSSAQGESTVFDTAQFLDETERKALKTGEYTFLVTEEQSIKTASDFGWTYVSNKQYRVQVLVSRDKDANGEYKKTWIVTEYSSSDTKDNAESKDKFKNFAFENTYNKESKGPDPDHYDETKEYELTIGKKVDETVSAYIDRNQLYTVEVVITVPATTGKETVDGEEQYVINEEKESGAYKVSMTCATHDTFEDGESACSVSKSVDKKSGTITYIANYRDGDTITISKIAVGATYTVKETNTGDLPNWTGVQYKSSKAGKVFGSTTGKENSVDTFETQTFVEGDASVEVQNYFTGSPETGVTTDVAPYVTLVAFAVVAVAAYAVLKRRMAR